MIDPVSVPALAAALTGILNGATGEIGASSVKALAGLVRSAGHGSSEQLATLIDARSPADQEHIFAELLAIAAQDEVFAAELDCWITRVDATGAFSSNSVVNKVDGTVHGPVVQGRDFSCPIHLG